MSSYLEAYGAAEEHRSQRLRLLRNISIAVAALIIVGLILFFTFRNHSQEQQARTFVQLLQAHNYAAAYQLWGCTESRPCPDYSFAKFQEDWGPSSPHADESAAHIGMSQSCGSGVIVRLDYKGSEEPVPLFVERSTDIISFAPWAECPGTKHLRLGPFFRSLFGKSS
ncbi:MAG TPA: hypothetical protein VKX49_31280 [Bryobacteraceae bacterium]|nr:hypothetical protein [Bryobacteraceae bacterium]